MSLTYQSVDKVFTDWQISILYNSFHLDRAIQVMSDSRSKVNPYLVYAAAREAN
jgi:hypothetical protein